MKRLIPWATATYAFGLCLAVLLGCGCNAITGASSLAIEESAAGGAGPSDGSAGVTSMATGAGATGGHDSEGSQGAGGAGPSGGSGGSGGSPGVTISIPFSFQMAGAFVLGSAPLEGTAAQLIADHFSYIGNYAVNGCQNNDAPYSCAANGCAYPGNPSSEILSYEALRDWMLQFRQAGLYVGLWGVTYDNVEAEASCMAEVANTLRSTYGVTAAFFDVDGEKSFETHQDYSQRFVSTFNAALAFDLAKAYTPECHTAVPLGPWLDGGFSSIMPMAYWNDVGTSPSYCLQWSLAYGAPIGQSQVMLDGYRHGSPHAWSEYADDIQSSGGVGLSIWQTLHADEWGQWKSLIESEGIAIYDPAL